MSLISVIIPNYNHGQFLDRRIESILNQTFTDFEIIILDDASTDNSRHIIEKYRSDARVKLIVYNERNSGSPFLQWQKGIELATTDWIWIAESDDYCLPTFLEQLYPVYNLPGCVIAFNEAIWVNESDFEIKKPYYYQSFYTTGSTFIRQYMLAENRLVNAGQVIFRRSAAKNLLPDWLGYKQAGDYRFFCEVLAQGSVYASGSPQAYFVRHQQTVSSKHLDTDSTKDEITAVWNWMVSCNIVKRDDFRPAFRSKHVALDRLKNKIPSINYNKELVWLIMAGKQLQINISPLEIKAARLWQSLQYRYKHMVK